MKLLILTVCAVVAYAAADVSHIAGKSEQNSNILEQELDLAPDGSYSWGYKTENGIQASASGSVVNPESDKAVLVVQGDAKWVSPEGEQISVQYVADENGYQPRGSHIPTPPPIPPEILKSLEYIQAHPPPVEN